MHTSTCDYDTLNLNLVEIFALVNKKESWDDYCKCLGYSGMIKHPGHVWINNLFCSL